MTPEEWTYLTVLLFSIPIGFVFKRGGHRVKQFGGAAVGLLLTLITCNIHTLHSLVTILGTWVILSLSPRSCHYLTLGWTFSYLLFFRMVTFFGLPAPTPFTNAVQLLLTLKMVSLANEVQEISQAKKQDVTSFTKVPALGLIPSVPGLGPTLCYGYCYVGLMTGPTWTGCSSRTPRPSPAGAPCWRGPGWSRSTGCSSWGPRGSSRWTTCGPRPSTPGRCPSASSTCTEEGAPGAAPPEYDYETIKNIDPYGTDFCVRVRDGMRYWNMTVQWWLAQYIYKNAPFRSYVMRSGWTMLISAYWHGLHPGYYLSFLTIPLCLAAEGALEAGLRGRRGAEPELEPGRSWGAWLHWFLKMRAYDYMCMGFVLLELGPTLHYWRAVYFCVHLGALGLLLLGRALPRSAPRAAEGPRRAGPLGGGE
ncbi:membrane-bound acylglycerophosphatidylinositol O-acyltransferase MBOAT7 isoform X2 [Eretmochelys imbricata]